MRYNGLKEVWYKPTDNCGTSKKMYHIAHIRLHVLLPKESGIEGATINANH